MQPSDNASGDDSGLEKFERSTCLVPANATLARVDPDRVDRDRRRFLKGLSAVLVGGGLVAVAAQEAIQQWKDWSRTRSEWERKEKRARELFEELFGSPAPVRRSHNGRHPDNAVAELKLRPFLGMYDYEPQPDTEQTFTRIRLDGDLIGFGGPNSTWLTMLAWEFCGRNVQELVRDPDAILPLRFCGMSNRHSKDLPRYRIAYRRANGNSFPSVPWPLYDITHPERRWTPRGSGTPIGEMVHNGRSLEILRPLNNYVLISKLPNFMGSDREGHPSAWPQIVLFEGSNGIGTRAAELIVTPEGCEILEQIKHDVQGGTAFQAILEAYDLEQAINGDFFSVRPETVRVI